MQTMQTKVSALAAVSRRNMLKMSGAVLGGVTLTSLLPSAYAANSAELTDILGQTLMPDKDNPIRVNFNENALGMSPNASQAAIEAVAKANRYAKWEMPQLSAAVAQSHSVSAEYILLTAGSSEGIRASIAAYAGENVQFVIPELTYGDGEFYANINKLKVKKVPCKENWSIDIAGLKQAVESYDGPSLVYLVNPNNPTSTIVPGEEVFSWLRSKPKNTMFIVDEAYAEFVNDPAFRSVDALIKQGLENVILLKTFSKIHAMAGLRVGYVVALPAIVKNIEQYVAGEKLNYCGVCAALASMQDKRFLAYSKRSNDVSRKILAEALDQVGLAYLDSQTNFIFHKIRIPLADYQKLMADKFVLVGRPFPPATDWCRISLGTPEETLYIAGAIKKLNEQKLI